jgi:hypothetical protein
MNLILERTVAVPFVTSLGDVFKAADLSPGDYDWFVSDIETNITPPGFSDCDQWMRGEQLAALIDDPVLQFIWGVFSAVPAGFRTEVREAPYADGNPAYWSGADILPQLEGALFEIVCWDSSVTLLINLPESAASAFVAAFPDTRMIGGPA